MSDHVPARPTTATIEQVLVQGDLSKLTPDQRVQYYAKVCESLNLNPSTRPFDYLTLNGKLILYARKDATEQLRKRDRVSIAIVGRELVDDVYVVTARATTPDGRTDESIGAVSVAGLKGEARANAFMKSETKSKRRVTLSICGLGMLDETEVEDIPDSRNNAPPAPKPQPSALPPKADPPGAPPVKDRSQTLQEALADQEQKQPKQQLPANGVELLDRLTTLQASLVSQGLCGPGELLRHVTDAGERAGFVPALAEWDAAGIQLATKETRKFLDARKRQADRAAAKSSN